jgi:signal transduction histidine kinase
MVKSSANAMPATGLLLARGLGLQSVAKREAVIVIAAIAASALAVWMTLSANFLAHPGWLAAQKADLILGPVLSGIYWLRRRPASRFGPVMIAVGFSTVPYILQSSATPWLFSVGVAWEGPLFLATLALILAFPSGRLDGRAERLILGAGVVGVVVPIVVVCLLSPQISPGAAIASCGGACPANALLVSPHPGAADWFARAGGISIVVVDLATLVLIGWRFATGTPPRRRALVIGAPIALTFLATQIARQVAWLADIEPDTILQWTYVAAGAALWYGFGLALIAAELFAGRVLRRVVEASLRRPSLSGIEAMLRGLVGDPHLRLLFWSPVGRDWVDGNGVRAAPAAGQVLSPVERDGRPAAAIVHDAPLTDEPELVHTAGAVALLAQENAELELAWADSLRQLRDSRARLAAAGEVERRALERDLHDGAQQQITALLVKLTLIRETLPEGSAAHDQLAALESEIEETLQEVRRLAHGIYPVSLAESGIVGALRGVASRSGGTIEIIDEGIGRYAPEVESAVYYCCLEALQNATKHAGPGAAVVIRLYQSGPALHFVVHDDGPGFDPSARSGGVGLRNIHDRIDALHGRLEITSLPGRGAVVAGAVPAR